MVLDRPDLDAVPGTVSVWLGGLRGPAWFTRDAEVVHAAASTLKVAVLAALFRAVDAGEVDLAEPVTVVDRLASAAPGEHYTVLRRHDSDERVWQRLGGPAPLGWLARRMIVRSSNLATNLILSRIGLDAVGAVWAAVGATASRTERGISDTPGDAAGLVNQVTAADLATLMRAIANATVDSSTPAAGRSAATGYSTVDSAGLVGPASAVAMLDILAAQELRGDLAAGLPPGTRVALKNGWITGVRHAVGVVYPGDAAPFVLAVCTTTPWARNRHDDEACHLVAAIARAAWSDRHHHP